MNPVQIQELAISPALQLLPSRMTSRDATVMLVAIALQESALQYRQQVLRYGRRWWEWRGPARGWWQFEPTGLRGVLTHGASQTHMQGLITDLGYESPMNMMPLWLTSLHEALKHNDVLAAGTARLLLWTLPQPMATTPEEGLDQYIDAWRPGAWFRGTPQQQAELAQKWNRNWHRAQEAVI